MGEVVLMTRTFLMSSILEIETRRVQTALASESRDIRGWRFSRRAREPIRAWWIINMAISGFPKASTEASKYQQSLARKVRYRSQRKEIEVKLEYMFDIILATSLSIIFISEEEQPTSL